MHVEWGFAGLRESARLAETAVVVDVLSFSTTVSVAVGRGAAVYPVRPGDGYAPAVAERLGAHLAGPRGSRFSLSPATADQLEPGERLVLGSPNGAALSLAAARRGLRVVAACLRNASAVGGWLREHGGRVVVVAAGKHWRDGTDRFAIEDLLGAGAVLSHLDPSPFTPEAHVAAAAFRAAAPHLEVTVRDCTSGRELAAHGFPEDPLWASRLDADDAVPVLLDGGFRAAIPA